jgi:nitrate/nitrite transporter NarK
MACLIFAAEAIFALPFHIPRFFRPTFLEVYGLSNADLGDAFAVYGVMAMLSYFPGGLVADRFSARKLLSTSLLATALGGVYLLTVPSALGLSLLFGYWGVTTILLFWAAAMRATREWGGQHRQGTAFGVLDGGRGLFAAVAASLGVGIFALIVGGEAEQLSDVTRARGLQSVVLYYTLLTALAAALTWWLIPARDDPEGADHKPAIQLLGQVLGRRSVWLSAGIVVCAYSGYKGLDNYGLYAVQVLGMNEVEAAQFTALSAYLRPVGAIVAGLVADRANARDSILVLFAVLLGCYLAVAAGSGQLPAALLVANLLLTYLGVFALRGIYFALLAESQVPQVATGTAVGVISVVGFTPEVFFAPVAGRLLDASPGVTGHQHYFLFLAALATLGLLVAWLLRRHLVKDSG